MINEFPQIPGTTIIGFGHKARHGKDYCCQAIHEAYPRMTKIYSFANALKTYCRLTQGMTTKDGPLLQRVGTDQLRAVDPLVLVRALYWQIDEDRPQVALISDLRFPNEADLIHGTGGFCVKVSRLNPDGTPYVAADRSPTHLSETALDDFTGWDTVIRAVSGETAALDVRAVLTFHDFLGRIADRRLAAQAGKAA